jgi:DNA replication protein DnaC
MTRSEALPLAKTLVAASITAKSNEVRSSGDSLRMSFGGYRGACTRGCKPRGPVISDDEAARRQKVESQRLHQANVRKLLDGCGVPKRYEGASLVGEMNVAADASANYRRAVARVARLETESGTLAIIGPRELGKTWIGCGMILDLCRRGVSARYLHLTDYLQGLKDTYGDKSRTTESRYESDHLRPHLLVIDELHERGDTAWEDRKLTRLITKRHEAELSTLLLSNDDEETFKHRVGDSVVSRCFEDAGGIFICVWKNQRRQTSQKGAA